MAAVELNKRGFVVAILATVFVLIPAASRALAQTLPRVERVRFERLNFNVDDKIPARELLPTPPKTPSTGMLITDDLARVPEVQFQEPIVVKKAKPDQNVSDKERARVAEELTKTTRKAMLQNAHQLAKINYLNLKKRDLFMETLLESRPDLAGLPFMMGDACRVQPADRPDFKNEVTLVRDLHDQGVNKAGQKSAERFWTQYDTELLAQRMKKKDRRHKDQFTVDSLMQILGPEPREYQLGLVPRLKEFGNERATQALVRLAVFSTDAEVRRIAVEALQKRATKPSTDILLQGLRYPWPSVAQNSAEAAVQLKRADLIPELIKMLEEPDPRAPRVRHERGKKTPVVRELVRINHHRNCMLCHAPGNTEDVTKDSPTNATWTEVEKGVQSRMVHGFPTLDPNIVVASVPTPGEDIESVRYYSFASPDMLVRADVTYLRQDFSLLQKVEGAYPWPDMQRFDYLVRTRALSESEAQTYREAFADKSAASPYRQAALSALRRLTGKDLGTTAEQWRTALGL